MGSVIKLLTPSSREYNDEYNEWLRSIPQHVKELVFVVKRFHRPEWGNDWRKHYSVDVINGRQGYSLKLDGRKLIVNTLRVGFGKDNSWRVFGLRHDFHPAIKVQTEDDITASVVARPARQRATGEVSQKYVKNCERYLFQRPDDAIHRGYDGQAEADIALPDSFMSNFQPLGRRRARTGRRRDRFQRLHRADAAPDPGRRRRAGRRVAEVLRLLGASAHRRWQADEESALSAVAPDIANPKETASAELAMRLFRRQPSPASR
jgi:hypothetical protein